MAGEAIVRSLVANRRPVASAGSLALGRAPKTVRTGDRTRGPVVSSRELAAPAIFLVPKVAGYVIVCPSGRLGV